MMRKTILAVVAALAVSAVLAGCQDKSKTPPKSEPPKNGSEEKGSDGKGTGTEPGKGSETKEMPGSDTK
jgi:hypothetical protein